MNEELRSWAGPIAAPDPAELADRYAVSQLVKVYALGIDMQDYELTRSVFADDATAAGSTNTGPIDEYLPAVYEGATAFEATQHNITNQHVDIDGDRARVWSYAIAVHKAGPSGGDAGLTDLTMGVVYQDYCRRSDAGWLIASRSVVVQWMEGDLPERTDK